MPYEPPRSIIHLKIGGGDVHRLVTLAYAMVAAQNGYRIADNTAWGTQKGDELPDLVISKEDSYKEGARKVRKVFRYAIEIIDTNDPVPEGLRSGYDDTIKVYVKKAEEWCRYGHGEMEGYTAPGASHPICLDSVLRLCDKSLP